MSARRVVAVRLPADVIESLDETADELTVSRNWLVQTAVTEYLDRLGKRMERGDSPAQVLGLMK